MAGEFALIARHFTRPARRAALGVGDDCALLRVAPGHQLAVSSDMLVEGRHFLSTVAPERLGHKALAVNLSDLAACGAEPLAFTLALALPRVDDAWLAAFAQGLFALADAHDIELVGGDTTAGPLNICITVFGQVPTSASQQVPLHEWQVQQAKAQTQTQAQPQPQPQTQGQTPVQTPVQTQALLRSGAQPGDDLWVSGALGDARLALEVFRGNVALAGAAFEQVRRAMEQPQPQVALGLALLGVAHAAIDLSDGLLGDLGHVLQRSGVGAEVHVDALPRSAVLAAQPLRLQHECLLAGGDDYELLFTAAPARRAAVAAAARHVGVAATRCGVITAAAGLRVVDTVGRTVATPWHGFDHFA